MDRLALSIPADPVEIKYERPIESHLTRLFRSADNDPDAYVCARSRTPLTWLHFNSLYETMMKSTKGGVLAAEGIYSHQIWEMDSGVKFEYSGSDYARVRQYIETGSSTFKHDAGEVELFTKTADHSASTTVHDLRQLQPKSVTLLQKWRFTYNCTYFYTLVKCSVGKTRADACLATEQYYWELAIKPTQSHCTRTDVSRRNVKFLAKLDDLVGRYERRV